jgi:hypothetical protein
MLEQPERKKARIKLNFIIIVFFTLLKSTAGFFPRHKFDKHHTAFRTIVNRVFREKILEK